MPIRCRLPELRARHGRLTLSRLSQETGIALSNLSKLDRSITSRIDFATLEALCRHFTVTPGDLLELVEDEPPKVTAEPANSES